MTENEYKNLPDFAFRSQYDVTPKDSQVEAALRGEMDAPDDRSSGFGGFIVPTGFQRLR